MLGCLLLQRRNARNDEISTKLENFIHTEMSGFVVLMKESWGDEGFGLIAGNSNVYVRPQVLGY